MEKKKKHHKETDKTETDKTDPTFIANHIEKLQSPTKEKKWIVQQVTQKNVFVIGSSGTGKSTLFEVLKKENYVPPTAELFCQTIHPKYSPLVCRNEAGEAYSLNFIDTPGLFEVSGTGENRTNSQILELIATALQLSVTKVSAILIVYRLNVRLKDEDIKLIELLSKWISPQMRKNCFLTFTYCENFKPPELAKKVKSFLEADSLSIFRGICQGGVFFVGALDRSGIDSFGEDLYMGTILPNVSIYRDDIITRLMNCSDISISDTLAKKAAASLMPEIRNETQKLDEIHISVKESSSGGCIIL